MTLLSLLQSIIRNLLPAVLALSLWACSEESLGPEAELRAWLQAGEEYAEQRDIGALADMIDDGYADSRGNDRQALLQQLRLYGFTDGWRELVLDVQSIELGGSDAADMQLMLHFADRGTDRGFNAGRYNVKLELRRKSDGEWTLLRAQWARAGERLR